MSNNNWKPVYNFKHIKYNNSPLDPEKTCFFTGHRPNGLYGYNLSDERYIKLFNVIRDGVITLYKTKGVTNFITGGALGLDTLAFIVIDSLKKEDYPFVSVLAIPFYNQFRKWNKKDIEVYEDIRDRADVVIFVDEEIGYSDGRTPKAVYSAYKLNRRNEWMIDHAKYGISVKNSRTYGGTFNAVKYALESKCFVINIDPLTFNIEKVVDAFDNSRN